MAGLSSTSQVTHAGAASSNSTSGEAGLRVGGASEGCSSPGVEFCLVLQQEDWLTSLEDCTRPVKRCLTALGSHLVSRQFEARKGVVEGRGVDSDRPADAQGEQTCPVVEDRPPAQHNSTLGGWSKPCWHADGRSSRRLSTQDDAHNGGSPVLWHLGRVQQVGRPRWCSLCRLWLPARNPVSD